MLAPLALALALAASHQDASDAPRLPVSLAHIRAGLQRTPVLRVDARPPEPTFRTEIVQHPYFIEIPHTWTFGGGGYASSAPAATPGALPPGTAMVGGTDLLPLVTGAARAVREHAAHREVQQAFADFCAKYSCVLR
ncbi:MAG TPA: hypothetical protein VFA27_12980 [Vicinamibacterales bacterium]|nr:hypothetical protein [Vicinamibacterales bacterium]